jgi:branched-chain amino acid transport system ATP-binding protein
LSNVNFSIARGEIVGLMGDRGVGKSSLVEIVAGAFSPSERTIRFEG